MRIGQFRRRGGDQPRLGIVDRSAGTVVDVPAQCERLDIAFPTTTGAALREPDWRSTLHLVADEARDGEAGTVPLSEVELCAPLTDARRVVGVGLNYRDHAEESGNDPPDEPVLFAKLATPTGPNDPVAWDPALTSAVDYEAELCVVVGDRASDVPVADARSYIAGFTVGNDVSARDLQRRDGQWVRAKSLDTFAPVGPTIVTPEEVADVGDLSIWAERNGRRLQESNTGEMLFGVDELVSFCSSAFTLEPGDVIFTGTPAGVGAFHDPPEYLADGDRVTVGVEGIGELANDCVHEA